MSKWKTTDPPKIADVHLKLRYKEVDTGIIRQGVFYWSNREKAWIERMNGPDGFAIYENDNWYVIKEWK